MKVSYILSVGGNRVDLNECNTFWSLDHSKGSNGHV